MTMKRISIVILIGLAAVLCALLSGCVNLDPSFVRNPDGTTTLLVPTKYGTLSYNLGTEEPSK